MNHVEVSVVIANWNTTSWLKKAVESVFAQEDVMPEIIIVDNGSSDGVYGFIRQMRREHPKRVRSIFYGKNYGPGRAWNDGIQLSRGKHVCILNSDAAMEKSCLKKMLTTLKNDRMIGMTGPLSNNISSAQGAHKPVDRKNSEIKTPKVMPFVCVLIPRPVIQDIGLLAERFEMGGAEDIEYCNRIRGAGYKIVITGRAFCWHALSQAYKANKVNVNKANRKMLKKMKENEAIRRLS